MPTGEKESSSVTRRLKRSGGGASIGQSLAAEVNTRGQNKAFMKYYHSDHLFFYMALLLY